MTCAGLNTHSETLPPKRYSTGRCQGPFPVNDTFGIRVTSNKYATTYSSGMAANAAKLIVSHRPFMLTSFGGSNGFVGMG